jgi:hypothetical protein
MAHKTDNPANKWHKQRENNRRIGENVDDNRHGEVINRDE